jgi:hypothetical protein
MTAHVDYFDTVLGRSASVFFLEALFALHNLT